MNDPTTKRSLVIPVYGNEGTIAPLLEVVADIQKAVGDLEAVFVVDGSPDDSVVLLREALPGAAFSSRLVELSRNFGAFEAVRVGLQEASGQQIAVMTADLQEPPELIIDFFARLDEGVDVVIGAREGRDDPFFRRLSANIFWSCYRRLVQREMPKGGADVFACNQKVRDALVGLEEANSSLIGLLIWLGFEPECLSYRRQASEGSGWTLAKRWRYLSDSIFAFSDLPVRLLLIFGGFGMLLAAGLGISVATLRLTGRIDQPGYSAIVTMILFFAGLNSFGLGIVGSYVWRAFENTKRRPLAIVQRSRDFKGGSK